MPGNSVLPDSVATLLARTERIVRAQTPAAIVDRVETLVRDHDAWRMKCLNMNPAEGLMSRRCRRLLDSDMATRLTEGLPGQKSYPHGRQNEAIDEIEAMVISLARIQFGCRYVEWRPVSTSMANAAVFFALLQPGDCVLSQDEDAGGNYSYQPVGPLA
jgi:glycine/serine hydroxymethyltransferase